MAEKITRLGKYTLGEQLGSGGFGTVFKASDSIGRTVAIKLLKPGWTDDPAAIERFRREAQVAGELFHNRIATIIDFDEQDGRLFLVMRYVDGQPLDKLIKQKGHLEWAQSIQILEQVADGLDYAHQRGFTHRDIKPSNILVSEKDGAVLTDFGLVKAADVSGMSTSGVMLGTPYYIAPEIWQGNPAGPAVDIYSLACVACEMLTGQVLFAGVSPPEIMTKHMLGAPQVSTDLPAPTREVLLRALERDPARRPPSASAFIADLKKSAAPAPHNPPAPKISTPITAPRPAHIPPTAFIAAGHSRRAPATANSIPKQLNERVELGWQEKSMPVLLILMGLVFVVFGFSILVIWVG
jgi:serine/threonine-protein kinase